MNKLKELREVKGYTPTQLAAVVGVSEQTVLRWQKLDDLSSLSYEMLEKLSSTLETPINFFVENNN